MTSPTAAGFQITPVASTPTLSSNHTNDPHHPHPHPPPLSPKGYTDLSTNDLTTLTGALLLTADCMGTGILALPHDMKVLGSVAGLSFLILNLPINWYAGKLLGDSAAFVECRAARVDMYDSIVSGEDDVFAYRDSFDDHLQNEFEEHDDDDGEEEDDENGKEFLWQSKTVTEQEATTTIQPITTTTTATAKMTDGQAHTYDFLGMTNALFGPSTSAVHLVTFIYYTNLILVLGNYTLVVSHSLSAIFGDDMCVPMAGVWSGLIMVGVLCQLRTMSDLGRVVSFVSLGCLAIVVVLCLLALWEEEEEGNYYYYGEQGNNGRTRVRRLDGEEAEEEELSTLTTIMRQFAAISSIGFAVGSQKLFLNIRHEFQTRSKAPNALALALLGFGTVYVTVCLAAGKHPPSFLFDAIPSGPNRRWAGFFLWVHVSISFAINSQAFCSSLDRIYFYSIRIWDLNERHGVRWCALTFGTVVGSLFISNAIPFFKDLVALIGALTSVPLTLLLPAIYHRKIRGLDLFGCGFGCCGRVGSRPMALNPMSHVDSMGLSSSLWQRICDRLSFGLVVFSMAFLICGLIGSIYSIEKDWANQRQPFACH